MALDPNKKFLYFNKDATITEMDLALCFPVSSFIGIEVQTSSLIDFYFEGSKGTDATVVRVLHEQYAYIKSFMISLVDEINFGEKAFIKVYDHAQRDTYPSDITVNMVLDSTPVFTLEDNDFVIADDVSIGGNLTFDSVALTNIQTSAESFINDDVSLMTSASIEDKILSYGYSTTTGDITGVTITTDSGGGSQAVMSSGTAGFSVLGATGVGVTNSGTTITAVAVPGEIDHDSLQNFASNEHYTQANIVATGTIASGTWEGTAIASAYLDSDTAHLSVDQTFTSTKTMGVAAKLQFRDANSYINSPTSNDLEIVATDIVLDAATSIALEAPTTVTGAFACTSRTLAVTTSTDGNHNGDVFYFGDTQSLTIGKIYHYNSSGDWELVNADAASTCDGLLAVALGDDSDTNGMLLRGFVTLDHDPGAVGDVLYAQSDNAGVPGNATATAPSASGDCVRVIGYQVNHPAAGMIWFNPDNTFVEVA